MNTTGFGVGRYTRIITLIMITLVMLWVLGCELGKESSSQTWSVLEPPSVTPVSGQATLIPDRGVKVSAGNVMVVAQFPAGAVSEPVLVRAEFVATDSLPSPVPAGMECLGAASFAPREISLLAPAILTLPVSRTMPAGTLLNVHRLEGSGATAEWILTNLKAKVDASGLSASFETTRLHTFALFSENQSGPLSISGLEPTAGSRGTMVAITGSGFGKGRGSSYVTFGSSLVAVYGTWSDKYIQVVVPPTASSGEVRVVIGGSVSNSRPFIVVNDDNPPLIDAITPVAGSVSTIVTITGQRFGLQRLGSAVYFAGVPARGYTSWKDTAIEAVVPVGGSSGELVVKISGRGSNAFSFSVTTNVEAAPVIQSVTPASAAPGASLVITGFGFGNGSSRSRVGFNGMEAAVYTLWTDTRVELTVPSGATSGDLVLGAGQRASNPWPFQIVQPPPAIGLLTPVSGYPGTKMTLSGTNFGLVRGDSQVFFGEVPCSQYESWGDSTIVCTVPDTAISGNVFVRVTGVTSNGLPFTIAIPERWDIVTSPATEDLRSLVFQGATGWACGGDVPGTGYIMKYQGGVWSTQAHSASKSLFSMAFGSDGRGWAVGGDYTGSAMLSYSAGTWSSVVPPSGQSLFDIHLFSADDGWAVGNDGTILRLQSGVWSTSASPTSNSLFGVHFSTASEGWAVGGDWAGGSGTILRYSSGTWNNFSSPTALGLRDVYFISQNLGWSVGAGGTILHYDGATWSTWPSPTSMDLVHVRFTAANNGWAVGSGGTVLRFDGTSWKRDATPTGAVLRAMHWENGQGWAVGDGGTLLKYGN
jgi:hypothetical protein